MIGCYEDAVLALERYRAKNWDDLLSPDGSTRMVYLINGVVYKVDGGGPENEYEFQNIHLFAKDLPKGFYFPDVSLFNVDDENVIAMEYIEGIAMAKCYCEASFDVCDSMCAPPFVVDVMHKLGFDSGGLNVIDCEGAYYIIDAA